MFAALALLAGSALAATPEVDAAGAALRFEKVSAPAFHFTQKPVVAPKPPVVCSALDLTGAVWPPQMGEDDRAALTLSLNISGSFEGAQGWANLSDDFDGQGVSMGLLNQNLGQGSLQPMLIRMRDEHPERLRALVSADHLKSLLGMLAKWQSVAAAGESFSDLSALDEPSENTVSGRNAAGVEWARDNLYDNNGFVPSWKAELIALASSPEFVSIQLAAAGDDHEKAVAYEKRAGVNLLRAYLFFFDVVVQNGGFYDQDFDDYFAWLKKEPKADASARLKKLLTLRLRKVRAKYRHDVLTRKTAIIDGAGRVHGESRDLPKQYCYDGDWPYRFDISAI